MNWMSFLLGMWTGIACCLIGMLIGWWWAKRGARRSTRAAEAAKKEFEAKVITSGVPEHIAVTVSALIEYERPDLAARWLMADLVDRDPEHFPPRGEQSDERG